MYFTPSCNKHTCRVGHGSYFLDTSLRFELAGDQYVDKVVSGLPLSSSDFAVLPPDFESAEETDISFEMFPYLQTYMNRVARFVSASVLFSMQPLFNIMPPTHPFLISSFMTSPKSATVGERIKLKYAWENMTDVTVEVVNPTLIEQQQFEMLDTGTVPPPLGPVSRSSIPSGSGD